MKMELIFLMVRDEDVRLGMSTRNVDGGTHALVEDVDVNNDTYGAILRVAMTRTLNPKPQGPKI